MLLVPMPVAKYMPSARVAENEKVLQMTRPERV